MWIHLFINQYYAIRTIPQFLSHFEDENIFLKSYLVINCMLIIFFFFLDTWRGHLHFSLAFSIVIGNEKTLKWQIARVRIGKKDTEPDQSKFEIVTF